MAESIIATLPDWLYKPYCILSYLEALKPIVAFESDRMFICASITEIKMRSKILKTSKNSKYLYNSLALKEVVNDPCIKTKESMQKRRRTKNILAA